MMPEPLPCEYGNWAFRGIDAGQFLNGFNRNVANLRSLADRVLANAVFHLLVNRLNLIARNLVLAKQFRIGSFSRRCV